MTLRLYFVSFNRTQGHQDITRNNANSSLATTPIKDTRGAISKSITDLALNSLEWVTNNSKPSIYVEFTGMSN